MLCVRMLTMSRVPGCVQVHMLLLAHLSREEIPPILVKDLNFVLTKGLPLLQEMLGIAILPRVQVVREVLR
jgi:hypothetical protein